MLQHHVEAVPEGDLRLDHELLKKAGLRGRLRLIIQPGEIRILPETPTDAEGVLNNLAGCLGQESAAEYDFGLKIGGLYEAR